MMINKTKITLIKKYRLLYLAMLPGILLLFAFHYIPIYGIIIAFKDYKYNLGFWGSPWNNFLHFKMLFTNPYFLRIFKNTVLISTYRIIFGFPAPILFALLLNEIRQINFKKIVQTISYLPHFISWVVLASIIVEILSPQRGIVGYIYRLLGKEPVIFLTDKTAFVPILIITGIWQSIGWGSIIYLASIAAINPELYEAATIDGAGRFQQALYITIPSIVPVITIMFILSLGGIMNAGFDQIFNLYNPLVYKVADIIDTYVYRIGILERQYGFTTAVGLFKNAIGIFLILGSNLIIRRYSEYGIW